MERPLLFVDVDGPLNPWAAAAGQRPDGYAAVAIPARLGAGAWRKPAHVWLDPAHGPALLALGYDLCWATAWMGDANRWIGPAIGLPDDLPFVDFTDVLFEERPDGVHWKTRRVLEYAAGRPFAWIDDEFAAADHDHVAAAARPAPALLHPVDPRRGLTPDDFTALAAFAATIREPTGS